ncbi:Uncharacterised protein [Mycobacteroides abscessus subsp. abscessus]|nr:Uncharacterised protein [Mycobacteroides abscessus subsp. abscessus]
MLATLSWRNACQPSPKSPCEVACSIPHGSAGLMAGP